MTKIISILLLAWFCLNLAGYFWYVESVESDLLTRSQQAVPAEGYEWLDISLQGRDVTLHGNAPDKNTVQNAIRLIKKIYGVRVVAYEKNLNELSIQIQPTKVNSSAESVEFSPVNIDGLASNRRVKISLIL